MQRVHVEALSAPFPLGVGSEVPTRFPGPRLCCEPPRLSVSRATSRQPLFPSLDTCSPRLLQPPPSPRFLSAPLHPFWSPSSLLLLFSVFLTPPSCFPFASLSTPTARRDFIPAHGFIINKLMISKPLAVSWAFNLQTADSPWWMSHGPSSHPPALFLPSPLTQGRAAELIHWLRQTSRDHLWVSPPLILHVRPEVLSLLFLKCFWKILSSLLLFSH